MSPKVISAGQVHASLSYPAFVDSLHEVFAAPHTMPPRQVLLLDPASGSHDAFAMLPSWNEEVICQKAFTYFPGNHPPAPTLHSQILLFDRKTGAPLALVDGVSVTCWRPFAVVRRIATTVPSSASATEYSVATLRSGSAARTDSAPTTER